MHITFIEIQNFRKLKSVRIDFSRKTTLLVGANNSGKTSATLALRHFLVEPEKFTTNDFTLSNWSPIETIAADWEAQAATPNAAAPTLTAWEPALPSLDVWLEIGTGEIHYVRRLLPTLDWVGGALGVRLRFEPKKVEELYKDYLTERKAAQDTKTAGAAASGAGRAYKLKLWPENMRSYLDRRLRTHFAVRAYLLDPKARVKPTNGIAKPQLLPKGIGPVEGNPLNELIRVNAIAAQRGLTLEHHMVAKRMGFLELFASLDAVREYQTGLRDGSLPLLQFFSTLVLPLVTAKQEGNEFAVAALVREKSPFLSKEILTAPGTDQIAQVMAAKAGVDALMLPFAAGAEPTFLAVLKSIAQSKLFRIPESLRPFVSDSVVPNAGDRIGGSRRRRASHQSAGGRSEFSQYSVFAN